MTVNNNFRASLADLRMELILHDFYKKVWSGAGDIKMQVLNICRKNKIAPRNNPVGDRP